MNRTLWLFVGLLGALLNPARADAPALLKEAADKWLGERDRWSFRQHVREFDGDRLFQERVEHYSPARGEASRWLLLSIDGRKPTHEEWAEWNRRKNKKRRHVAKPVAEYFDFDRATLTEETPQSARFDLPLRSNVEWLFPVDKVALTLTVNRSARALEKVQARISEPFRVVLGLARILDIDLDLQMQPPGESAAPSGDPAEARPSGTASAVVRKLGKRVEYAWSDFERVSPRHPDGAGPPAAP